MNKLSDITIPTDVRDIDTWLGMRSMRVQAYAILEMLTQYTGFRSRNSKLYSSLVSTILQTIKSGGRVILTGVGKNSNLATKASETFASLGIPSMYLNAGHYAHGDAGFILDNDMVIHISRSGTTSEMQYMKNHLHKTRPGITQVLLHCNGDLVPVPGEELPDNLQKYLDGFDLVLDILNIQECDRHSLAPTTTTTVLLVLLDSLAITVSDYIGFTREDFLMYHPGGALGAMLNDEFS